MNNIAEAAESHYRTIISAQFEVILLFVLTCTFNAYTRLTGPRFRGGSGRGMTLNCSRFFGIHRSAAIAALLFALLAVCTTPSAVWAVTSAILDTGRLYVDDVDLVVAARPVRLEVRRTLLARPDPHGLLGARWRLNWERNLFRVSDLVLLTDTLGTTTFAPAKQKNIFQNARGERLSFDESGTATYARANGTVERYDAEGQFAELVDRNNNRTVLRYSETGVLESIRGPHKAELLFKTDEAGRLTGIETSTGDKVSYAYQGDLLSEAVVHDRRTTLFFYDKQGALTRIEDPVSGGVEFRYDAKGRVTEKRASGGSQTFEFDDNQRKVSKTNNSGGVTSTQWSKNGRRKEVVNPLGYKTISEYDEQGRLVRTTGPDGHTTRFGYDELGRTTVVAGPGGHALRFKYKDTGDRVASIHYPEGRVEQFEYDKAGNLKSSKGLEAGDIELSYFSNGLPKEVKGPGSRVRRFTYTDAGQIASITDGSGNAVSYEYDAQGRLIRDTNPLGGTTIRQYDDAGRVTQETSASGRTVRYQYDDTGRRTAVLDSDAEKISYKYDSGGLLVAVKRGPGDAQRYEASPSGDRVSVYQGETLVEERRYDKAGQLIQSTDALGQVYRYEYDRAGRLSVEQLPGGSKLAYQYDNGGDLVGTEHSVTGRTLFERDAAGRITKWTEPGGASWKYHYDKRGRLSRQGDPNGHSTRFTYGAGGELKEVTTATGARALYEYDSEGNLSAQGGPGAVAIKFRRDAMGNVTEMVDAAGHGWQYAYNKAGDITRATDALGRTISYEYDAQGRLSTERTEDGHAISYQYGSDGALTRIDDGAFPVAYRYDGNGRLESTRYPAIDQSLHYAYDRHGRRTELRAADGYRVRYEYDALGRVAAIHSATVGQFRLSYDAAERLTALAYPNGVTGKWSYDGAGRVRSLVYHDAAGKTLASWQYDYDKAGNPIKIGRSHEDTRSYHYDPDGRLVKEANSDRHISYHYAPSGDRTKRQHKSGAHGYRYGKAGRVLSAGPESFGHDANGNLVSRKGPAGKTTYQFDAAGRLVGARLPDREEVTFRYAPSGERVARHDKAGTRYLLYDGLNLLQELDENGAVVASYTHGPGLDWPLAMVRIGRSYFYHADAFGNIALLSDVDGKVAARYETDAFGSLVTRAGDVDNPFIFSGREYDARLGLYYFRSRYYDPALGRFLSPDPVPGLLSDPASLNRYAYARNAPTRYRDPLGLYEIDYGWIQRNLGLSPDQVDDLVLQERFQSWNHKPDISPYSAPPRPSPAQALSNARQAVESRLWYESMRPDSELTPSKIMSRVSQDIKSDYPKPKMWWEKGAPTQLDRYTGKTKVQGQPKAPSGRTTIAGRTRPGPVVRDPSGRTTVQAPQVNAPGVSPSNIAGGVGGLLGVGAMAVTLAACMDEGNSFLSCAGWMGLGVAASMAVGAKAVALGLIPAAAAPWVALAGGVYGAHAAGTRWSEAPAVEADERRRRQTEANLGEDFANVYAAVADVAEKVANLRSLRDTAVEAIIQYEDESTLRLKGAQQLEADVRPLLEKMREAVARTGPEGDPDLRCFKARLMRESIEAALARMQMIGRLMDVALAGASTLAGRCPAVENPGNIRTLYEGAEQRAVEMGAELANIEADAATVESNLSVLRTTHTSTVVEARSKHTAIAEKKTLLAGIINAMNAADQSARGTFGSGEKIREFNRLKRRLLQQIPRFYNAFLPTEHPEVLAQINKLERYEDKVKALEYPANYTSVISQWYNWIWESINPFLATSDAADALLANLPEKPSCTVESAADLVDRADTAYTLALANLGANQTLPARAETCRTQARTPAGTGADTSRGDGCDPTDPGGGCYDPRADSSGIPKASEEQVRQAAAAADAIAGQGAGQNGGDGGTGSSGETGATTSAPIDCEYTGTCPEPAETATTQPAGPGATTASKPGWAGGQPGQPSGWEGMGEGYGFPPHGGGTATAQAPAPSRPPPGSASTPSPAASAVKPPATTTTPVKPPARKYGIYLMFGVNTIWVGEESSLKGKANGDFDYGGKCKDAKKCPVEYRLKKGPYSTYEQVKRAFCSEYHSSWYSLGVNRVKFKDGTVYAASSIPSCPKVEN